VSAAAPMPVAAYHPDDPETRYARAIGLIAKIAPDCRSPEVSGLIELLAAYEAERVTSKPTPPAPPGAPLDVVDRAMVRWGREATRVYARAGRCWATDRVSIIAVQHTGPVENLPRLPIDPDDEDAVPRGERRAPGPVVTRNGDAMRDIGDASFSAERIELVERLFPGCEWWAPSKPVSWNTDAVSEWGAVAMVGEHVVALIAPIVWVDP